MVHVHHGTCFCGAVEITATGEPLEMGYCHCADCRAHSGAPFVAYILWNAESVTVTSGADLVGRYNKTGISDRKFCTRCGGKVLTNHPDMSLTDVPAAVLPTVEFTPTVHLNYGSAIIGIKDGLTKLKDFPAEVGGSGEVIPE